MTERQASDMAGYSTGMPTVPSQFGRYRLERELGRGAMGQVFLAEDTQSGRQVALKIPKRSALDDPESLERFYREARTAAMLKHPNICPVYDVGGINGIPYLTMAYVTGKTVGEYLRKDNLPPHRQVALLIRKIARALAEAHRQGVVHRDLKPSNVMLDDSGEPIVMDFGLARLMNTAENARLTQSGAILGTPAYMAPEQVRGETNQIGPATDIYSLGVMMYQFLTGELPFSGPTAMVFAQVITQQPKRPSEVQPDVDPTLEAICLKMMAKEIEQRYASMPDVVAALTEYLKTGLVAGLERETDPEDLPPLPDPKPGMSETLSQDTATKPNGVGSEQTLKPLWPLASGAALIGLSIITWHLFAPRNPVVTREPLLAAPSAPMAKLIFDIEDPSLTVRFGDQEITAQQNGVPFSAQPGTHSVTIVGSDGEQRKKDVTVAAGETRQLIVVPFTMKAEPLVEVLPREDEEKPQVPKPEPKVANPPLPSVKATEPLREPVKEATVTTKVASVDRTFGENGTAMVELPDYAGSQNGIELGFGENGEIIAASFGSNSRVTQFLRNDSSVPQSVRKDRRLRVIRFLQDGSLDRQFGDAGIVTFPSKSGEVLSKVLLQPDGNLVVLSTAQRNTGRDGKWPAYKPYLILRRYMASGDLDRKFGNAGTAVCDFPGGERTSGVVSASGILHPDGKITVGGRGAIRRYQADGKPDEMFGNGQWIEIGGKAEALQGDGNIIASVLSRGDSRPEASLVRYLQNGALDSGFGTQGRLETSIVAGYYMNSLYAVSSVVIQPDGKIVTVELGKLADGEGNSYVLTRYNNDGILDQTFNGGRLLLFTDWRFVATQGDGTIIYGGDFGLAAYEPDGKLAKSFFNGGKFKMDQSDFGIEGLSVSPDGAIIAVGLSVQDKKTRIVLTRLVYR